MAADIIPTRRIQIEMAAGEGHLEVLQKLLEKDFAQEDLDVALENAIAYSQIETAKYLLKLGADLSNANCQGLYYAVQNNQLPGLQFGIAQGVDVNINRGMLLNEAIITAYNTNDIRIALWLLENGADPQLLSESSRNNFNYGTPALKAIVQRYLGKFTNE